MTQQTISNIQAVEFGAVRVEFDGTQVSVYGPTGWEPDVALATRSASLYAEHTARALHALACALHQQYAAWHGAQGVLGRMGR